jgi:hypothetical protein
MSDVLRVLAVFALVAANAFLVAAEFAVVAARRCSRGAQAALRLMDDPMGVISSTQVGITAIGILTGAVGEPLVLDLLGDDLPDGLAFLIALSFVTYLSAVFGELVPKALALDRAERILVAVAVPIEIMTKALRPVVAVLEASAGVALRPFGVRDVVAGETVRNAAELRAIVDEAEGAGVIPRAQEDMLHNVFDFADREAADVMVPAPDVVWLDGGLTPEQALDGIADRPYSRYPVAEGSLDSPRRRHPRARAPGRHPCRADGAHPRVRSPHRRRQRGARHRPRHQLCPDARRPRAERARPPAATGRRGSGRRCAAAGRAARRAPHHEAAGSRRRCPLVHSRSRLIRFAGFVVSRAALVLT